MKEQKRREELTDTMFEMLYTIENSVISQEGTKKQMNILEKLNLT